MKNFSLGLRAIEIFLFLLLFVGAFSFVFAVFETIFSVASGKFPSVVILTGRILSAPLLLIPALILWFWMRVPSPRSRFRILISLASLAIWLAFLGFMNVLVQSRSDQAISQSEFVVSILFHPAFIASLLCQASLFYITFSQASRSYFLADAVPGNDSE